MLVSRVLCYHSLDTTECLDFSTHFFPSGRISKLLVRTSDIMKCIFAIMNRSCLLSTKICLFYTWRQVRPIITTIWKPSIFSILTMAAQKCTLFPDTNCFRAFRQLFPIFSKFPNTALTFTTPTFTICVEFSGNCHLEYEASSVHSTDAYMLHSEDS